MWVGEAFGSEAGWAACAVVTLWLVGLGLLWAQKPQLPLPALRTLALAAAAVALGIIAFGTVLPRAMPGQSYPRR